MIELHCAEPSALLPNLRPGDVVEVGLVRGRLRIYADATPLMLTNILTAVETGSLRGVVKWHDVEHHLKALRDAAATPQPASPTLRAG